MIPLAVTSVVKPIVTSSPEMDGVTVYGFMVAFFMAVFLLYRHDFKTQLPLFPILLIASAAYGFMCGVWIVGFVLSVVAVSELWLWHASHSSKPKPNRQRAKPASSLDHRESRMSRMFGST